jgi:phosphate uptake regulator
MKHCKFCGDVIPDDNNGNRRYCDNDDICYDLAKGIRQSIHREEAAVRRKKIKNSENILRILCQKHGSNKKFDPMEAERLGLDYSISTGTIYRYDNHAVVIGEYAYFLLNPKNMIVWKV